MTNKEVKNNFVQNLAENAYINMCSAEEMKIAIEALEKQIPKKPDLIGDSYDDNGNLIYDTWICPCCETEYGLDYDYYKFCPECGQALDWSECNEI